MSQRKVFLSYAASDTMLASAVRFALKGAAPEVWSDDMITAGDEWSADLRERIREASVFVLILTPRALASSWVLHELGAAWALGKPIVVVGEPLLVDTLPVDLRRAPVVSANDLERVAEAVELAAA